MSYRPESVPILLWGLKFFECDVHAHVHMIAATVIVLSRIIRLYDFVPSIVLPFEKKFTALNIKRR